MRAADMTRYDLGARISFEELRAFGKNEAQVNRRRRHKREDEEIKSREAPVRRLDIEGGDRIDAEEEAE